MAKEYTVRVIAAELASAQALRAALADEDDQRILDCIEGETNLHEALLVLAAEVAVMEVMEAALSAAIDTMKARAGRFEATARRYREIIASAMSRAEIAKITSPECTLSLGAGARQPIVTDDRALPAECFSQKAPELSMKRLRALLEEGDVPGATWTNTPPRLTIRRK